MTTFMDLIKNIEKESKARTNESKSKNDDLPNCVNCTYVGRDGLRTKICVRCAMNTRVKWTRQVNK